jgi:hypothetical protein
MRIYTLITVFVMFSSTVMASELPSWSTARSVMEKCYSGFDGVITLDASLGATARHTRGVQGISSNRIGGDFTSNTTTTNRWSTTNGISTNELGTSSLTSSLGGYEDSSSVSANDYNGYDDYDRIFDETTVTPEAFIGVKLTVPLYSRADRLSRREKTSAQVRAVADLYAKYEGFKATAAALTEEGKVLRSLMLEGGESAIAAYFNLLAEKEKSIALMVSAHRTIMQTLDSCGYRKGE